MARGRHYDPDHAAVQRRVPGRLPRAQRRCGALVGGLLPARRGGGAAVRTGRRRLFLRTRPTPVRTARAAAPARGAGGMSRPISGATIVAGVAGSPVAHSLSPLIHNAWLSAAVVDGVYVPLAPAPDRFAAFAEGLRGGAVRGLNITVPFKIDALAVADPVTDRARRAGAANLLLFEPGGAIHADNTPGPG